MSFFIIDAFLGRCIIFPDLLPDTIYFYEF